MWPTGEVQYMTVHSRLCHLLLQNVLLPFKASKSSLKNGIKMHHWKGQELITITMKILHLNIKEF